MFNNFLSKRSGFTIVELIIAITVLGVLTALVLGPLGNFYSDSITSLGRTTQDTDTRSALLRIQRELTDNTGFVGTFSTQTPLGNNGSDSWNYLGDNSNQRILIARSYATTTGQNSSDRLPVFMKPGSGNCSDQADPVSLTKIYFMAKDSPSSSQYNLYRRTILPSTNLADYCGTPPYEKQSCASGCTTTDTILLRDVSSLKIDYYASTDDSSAAITTSDGADKSAVVDAARSAKLTLETKRMIQGKEVTSTATVQIAAGVYASMAVGSTDAGAGNDQITDPSGNAPISSFDTASTYTIPTTAEFIDLVLIGGGGGGQGGGFFNSGGHGGNSGDWNYTTLQRGVDIDQAVTQLAITIGGGGAGGNGYGSGANYTLLGAENGHQGGATTVTAIKPGNYGPQALKIDWPGITATGGGGGRTPPNNNEVPGNKAVPFTFYYLGQSYTAGTPAGGHGQTGSAPGGSGSGGDGALLFMAGRGGDGAAGRVWIRAY